MVKIFTTRYFCLDTNIIGGYRAFAGLDGSTSNRFKGSDDIYKFSVAAFLEIARHQRFCQAFFEPS